MLGVVRFLRAAPVWWAVAAGVLVVAVGLFTNLVTAQAASGWVVAGFVVAVASSLGLSGWAVALGLRDGYRELVARREELLVPFADPSPPEVGGFTVVSLLDPLAGLSPFVGRAREVDELRSWCTGSGPERVRVIDGDSGVGKTRLAREVARSLPPGWASGLVVAERAVEVVAAVVACGDPTLIVVDDADLNPGTAPLVDAVLCQEGGLLVRVLVLVRDAAAFRVWLAQRGPARLDRRWPVTHIGVAGADGDRRRWFAQMVSAYRRVLAPSPPPVPVGRSGSPRRPGPLAVAPGIPADDLGPVGAAGEPLMVTCARAALAAVAGGARADVDAVRTAGSDEVAAQLVAHEQRRWAEAAADPKWGVNGAGLTDSLRAKAVLALVLAGPSTLDGAVAVLQRLPALKGQPQAVHSAVVEWARHLYPGGAGATGVVAPRPDFLAGALVARCAADDHRDVLDAVIGDSHGGAGIEAGSLVGMVRAAAWFPAAAPLLGFVLDRVPTAVAAAIEAAALAGGDTRRAVGALLHAALVRAVLSDDTVSRLLDLTDQDGLWRLRVDLYRITVDRARAAAAAAPVESDQERLDLARSLTNLGVSLWEGGEHREALTTFREAVALWRTLAAAEPARHTPGLATSLNGLGASLREVGEHREALTIVREAVALGRTLAAAEPARHTPGLATSLTGLGASLREVGEHREALTFLREAVALWRTLAAAEPARHTPDLARSLTGLGAGLWEVGEHREALTTVREAVALGRTLAAAEPARHTPDLATSLNNLGISLADANDSDAAQRVRAEAVAWLLRLARLNPDEHNGRYQDAQANLARRYTEFGLDVAAAYAAVESAASKLPPLPRVVHDDRPGPTDDQDRATDDRDSPPPAPPAVGGSEAGAREPSGAGAPPEAAP
ncbi:MAG: tetratricopeptide repeat protein [Pseudonocardia sp.]